MATQSNDIDLTQLDLSDPETRKFAEGRIDLSDPETKKWWDSSAPVTESSALDQAGNSFGKGVRGVIQGVGGLADLVGGPVNAGINLMGGNLSTSPGHDLATYAADQLGLGKPEGATENLANAINEGGIQGILTAGGGMAASGAKGITGILGKALAETPILDTISGMTSGAAGETANQNGAGPWGQMGASLLGGLTPFGVKAAGHSLYKSITDDGMVPESDFVRDLFIDRGTDTTPGHDPRVPPKIDDVELANRLQAAYDMGKTADEIKTIAGEEVPLDNLDAMMKYREEHGKGGRFVPETPAETQLANEASAFKPKPEPTVTDLFPTEESQAAKSKAMEEKLQAEVDTFANRNKIGEEPVSEGVPVTEAKPAEAEAPKTVPDEVQVKIDEHQAHVDELTKDWTDAPSYKVVDSFDDIKGVDNDATGVIDENGNVLINNKKIDSPATLKAVVYHEGLGHHGLTKKFGDDLDDTLTKFYNESSDFKAEVDDWIKANPGAYADSPNLVARAADEVLAKWSEKGQIPVQLMDKIKNVIKNLARKARMWGTDYSNREIRTILGMAHDAVINGKPGDVRGNGFRFSKAANDNDIEDKKLSDAWDKIAPSLEDGAKKVWDGAYEAFLSNKEISPHGYVRALKKQKGQNGRWFSSEDAEEALKVADEATHKYWQSHVDKLKEQFSVHRTELGTDDEFTYDDGRPPEKIRTYTTEEVRQKLFEKTGKRYMNEKKSLSPEKMKTTNDVDELLDFLEEENLKAKAEPTSHQETIRKAEDMGLTVGKYLKGKGLDEQGISARLKAAQQLITNQLDDLEGLRLKAESTQMSPSLYAQIKAKLAIVQAIYAKFDSDTGEVGRALNILKDVSESKKSAAAASRFMTENEDIDALSDPESLMRFLKNLSAIKQVQGAEAAGKYFKRVKEFKAEDYVGSVVYNNMLSSPVTWLKNSLGPPLVYANDLLVKGVASIAGQPLRLTGGERVHAREVLANMYGPIMGLYNFKTLKNTAEAFMSGESKSRGLAGKTGGKGLPLSSSKNKVVKTIGLVSETPRRILAATDELWSNVLGVANIQAEAVKTAAKKGHTNQKDFWKEVNDLAKNPTSEMLTAAKEVTDRQLFRQKPGKYTQKLVDFLTPRYEDELTIKMVQDPETGKMVPTAKNLRPKSTPIERVGKFAGGLTVPFVPTLAAIGDNLVRNTPIRIFSKQLYKELMTPGVVRQSAIARMAVAVSVLTYWGMQYSEGTLTGPGSPDYKKQAALGAVRPPFSRKVGDEWVSYQGLDPVAGQMAAAAGALERGSGKIDGEVFTGMVSGMATALANSSYAESLINSLKLTTEAVKAVKDGEPLGTASANFLGGQASNLLTPSFVRWLNQEFLDPAARDTTGDDTLGGRISGRAISGTPVLSKGLPQKYDVVGRPVQNLRQPRKVETDPAILEWNRLEKTTDKTIIGPVEPTIKIGEEYVRLTSTVYQEYQKLAGEYILSDMKAEMGTVDWKDLTDEERVDVLKEVSKGAREDARDELFGEQRDEATQ